MAIVRRRTKFFSLRSHRRMAICRDASPSAYFSRAFTRGLRLENRLLNCQMNFPGACCLSLERSRTGKQSKYGSQSTDAGRRLGPLNFYTFDLPGTLGKGSRGIFRHRLLAGGLQPGARNLALESVRAAVKAYAVGGL
jgi:hypothetical protein